MANESLMFRKGLQASLATLPIKPGAISITIDEPGMYVDLPANAALGHSDAYRVRIGDVITVQTLGDLANLKLDALTPENLSDDGGKTSLKGRINEYSSSALYYVTGQNMLLKYNVATGKFIWINDTTSLQEQITALGSTVSGHSTRIGDLETKVGAAKNGNVAATGLYKEIEDVKSDLEGQIAGILGGGDGLTLQSVDAAIRQEAIDRADADSTLDGKITGLGGRLDTAEGNIQDIVNLIGAADSTNTSEVFGVINKEIQDRADADTGLSDRITAIENLDIDGTYAKQEDLTGLTTTVGNLSDDVGDLITAVGSANTNTSGTSNAAGLYKVIEEAIAEEKERAELAEQGLDTRLDTIEGLNIDNTYAKKSVVESLTNNVVNPLVTLVGDTDDTKDEQTVFGYIAAEKARAEGVESGHEGRIAALEGLGVAANYATKQELNNLANGAVAQNTQAITTINTSLENNYYQKGSLYTKSELNTKFDDITRAETGAIAVAEKAAKDYAKGLDDQVRLDYAEADAALDLKISGITQSLSGYATDGELEAAVETLSGAIEDAQSNAEANATDAAKDYTDAEIDKVELAYAAADEALEGKISNLTQSVYAKTETYTKEEVNAEIKKVTDVTNTYQAAWEKYADDKVKEEADARDAAINGTDGVATKLTAHIQTAEQTYETKEDAGKKLAEAKKYADDINTALDGRLDTLEAITHDAYIAADEALKTELQAEIDADVKVVNDALEAYKTSNNTEVAKKANSADVYAKTETYTQAEVDALISAAHTWGEF